jgi:hypothetical protein
MKAIIRGKTISVGWVRTIPNTTLQVYRSLEPDDSRRFVFSAGGKRQGCITSYKDDRLAPEDVGDLSHIVRCE